MPQKKQQKKPGSLRGLGGIASGIDLSKTTPVPKLKPQFPGYSRQFPTITDPSLAESYGTGGGAHPFYNGGALTYGEELARLQRAGTDYFNDYAVGPDGQVPASYAQQNFENPHFGDWTQSGIPYKDQPYHGSWTGARSIEGGLNRLGDATWLPTPYRPPQIPMPPNPEFYNPMNSSLYNMNPIQWGPNGKAFKR